MRYADKKNRPVTDLKVSRQRKWILRNPDKAHAIDMKYRKTEKRKKSWRSYKKKVKESKPFIITMPLKMWSPNPNHE